MSRKKKQIPSEAEFLRILEHPESRISLAAVVLTGGNYLAGVVLEKLRLLQGNPITMKALSDSCFCTYKQTRTALDDLVTAGLIEKKEQDIPFVFNRERKAPERKPFYYELTRLGQQCTPRKQDNVPPQPKKAEKQQKALIQEIKPKAPTIDGEKIARDCGLLRGSIIDYTDYDRKVQFLTSAEQKAVESFLDSKK